MAEPRMHEANEISPYPVSCFGEGVLQFWISVPVQTGTRHHLLGRGIAGCVDVHERVLSLTRNLEVPQQRWQGCVSLFRLHIFVPTSVSAAVPTREFGTVFQSEEQ